MTSSLQNCGQLGSLGDNFQAWLQARGQDAEALVAVESPLGDVITLAGERKRLQATLTVCARRSFILC